MSCGRVVPCVILPPLAALDKGCGSIAVITLLAILGWVPGIIGALIICNSKTWWRAAKDLR